MLTDLSPRVFQSIVVGNKLEPSRFSVKLRKVLYMIVHTTQTMILH